MTWHLFCSKIVLQVHDIKISKYLSAWFHLNKEKVVWSCSCISVTTIRQQGSQWSRTPDNLFQRRACSLQPADLQPVLSLLHSKRWVAYLKVTPSEFVERRHSWSLQDRRGHWMVWWEENKIKRMNQHFKKLGWWRGFQSSCFWPVAPHKYTGTWCWLYVGLHNSSFRLRFVL